MAVHLATGSDYLQRTTALLPASGNSTVCFWVKSGAISVGPAYQTGYIIMDDPGVYTDYAGLFYYTDGGGHCHLLDVGGTTLNTLTPTVSTWTHYTWVQEGTSQQLYTNGELIGTVIKNRAAWTNGFEFLGNDTFADGNLSLAYCREWTTALTQAQIFDEMQALTAVHTANLWMDCPLTSNAVDISGNGHSWTSIGSPTYVAQPSFPSNSSAATATAFSTLPQTITQDFGDGRYAWYSYTAATDQVVAGFYAVSAFGVDSSTISAWVGPTSAPVEWVASGRQVQATDVPIQVPVNGGDTYYFQVLFTAVPSTDVTISALPGPTSPAVAGSICVNDDTIGFPLAILDVTSGLPLQFMVFPASERGDKTNTVVLPSGITLSDDIDGNIFHLYDANLTQITTVAFPFSGTPEGMNSDQDTLFYVSGWPNAGNSRIATISDAGVVGGTTWTVSGHASVICPTRDNAKLYYAGTGAVAILTWILGTDSAGSTFAAAVAGYTVRDIISLSDGTFAVGYKGVASFVRHYAADGSTLADYTVPMGTEVNHVTSAIDDPNSVWVWLFDVPDETSSTFINMKMSDGSLLSTVGPVPQFDVGAYSPDPTASPVRFGHSNSCPFWILRGSITPIPPGDPVATTIRRERIFRHLSDEQQFIFYQWFQLDVEAGVGLSTGQGSDPQVILQWSDDGGHTWSNEHLLSAGKQGDYGKRAILKQPLGRSRDRVFKVAMSDPVKWALLNAYFGAEKSTS